MRFILRRPRPRLVDFFICLRLHGKLKEENLGVNQTRNIYWGICSNWDKSQFSFHPI